jgi:hypothetical protein
MRQKTITTEEETTDVRVHSLHIQQILAQLSDHLKYDILLVEEPQFEALMETTREVLNGLKRAFQHYDEKAEEAFRGQAVKGCLARRALTRRALTRRALARQALQGKIRPRA